MKSTSLKKILALLITFSLSMSTLPTYASFENKDNEQEVLSGESQTPEHQNNRLTHYLDQWTTRKLGNNSFYADWEISLTYDKNGNLLTNLTEGYDCIND